MAFTVTSTDELNYICARNQWFNVGTNEQRHKFIYEANINASFTLEQMAAMIWLCTDKDSTDSNGDPWCIRSILAELKEARNKYERYVLRNCSKKY